MDKQNNPFLGNSDNSQDPKNDTTYNSNEAADLVRAKLANLYGESRPNPAPASQHPQPDFTKQSQPQPAQPTTQTPQQSQDFQTFKIPRGNKHSPATGMLYQREQQLQSTIDHASQVTQPDHELPMPSPEYELPQAAQINRAPTTTQQPVQLHPIQSLNTGLKTKAQKSTIPPVRSDEQPVSIGDQLSRQATSPANRVDVIKRFAQQAEQQNVTFLKRLKFWQRSKAKLTKESTNKSKKHPMYRTALITALVLVLYNNQLISGQINYYISPGEAIVSPQIIDPSTNNSVGPEPQIIIPKINVQVPTVYGVDTRNDDVIQDFLEQGVVHYARTALPGQIGNTVILGHSSNSFWNGGQHKNAFSLLDRLEVGDTYMIHFEGTRYIYEVFNKEVIEPTDFRAVSQDTDGLPIATLITCTPPGTSWKRLIIQAEQISPDPLEAEKVAIEQTPEDQEIIAGNTSSLWDNIRDWLFD